MGNVMKTTLDLPDDLMRALKIRAAQQGRTIRELVSAYISAGLAGTPANAGTGTVAFPVIDADPHAALVTMTREQIIAAEYEALTADDDNAR